MTLMALFYLRLHVTLVHGGNRYTQYQYVAVRVHRLFCNYSIVLQYEPTLESCLVCMPYQIGNQKSTSRCENLFNETKRSVTCA
jgi:hypothetical protein